MTPLRVSDNTVTGTAEEITSDVIIPDTRIPSTPEKGSESNSGDISTEWNIGEQDSLFAGVFCGSWVTASANKKTLTLGNTAKSFVMVKKYPQSPAQWQKYIHMYVNQLTIDFATDAFVKLTWNMMGSNNPTKEGSDPLASKSAVYGDASTTKSFLTKAGWLKYGDVNGTLAAVRQSPSMTVTINNNLERTPALFESESIENSLGDFVVSGSFDVYNVDSMGTEIYNDAVNEADKKIQVRVQRGNDAYTLTMRVHLQTPTESKNGNKLQFSVPFVLNDKQDLLLEKETSASSITDADAPSFSSVWDESYSAETSQTLTGTATVSDGGTVSYKWYKDGAEIASATNATYSATEDGVYTVVATNTNDSATRDKVVSSSQTCTVDITGD